MADDTSWWWCLTHSRPEQGVASPAEERLGPYPTQDAAQSWRERHDTRQDSWEDADEAWDAWPSDRRDPQEGGGQTPA
jgi:hypothetical protein